MAPTAHWRNWGGNQECAAEAVDHPVDEAELVASVKAAAAAGQTVKAVGSGHSFTDIACTYGRRLELDGYNQILSVDRDRLQVTVQAGVTIQQLNRRLAELGWALPNLGDIEYQTISGAVSTASQSATNAVSTAAKSVQSSAKQACLAAAQNVPAGNARDQAVAGCNKIK